MVGSAEVSRPRTDEESEPMLWTLFVHVFDLCWVCLLGACVVAVVHVFFFSVAFLVRAQKKQSK